MYGSNYYGGREYGGSGSVIIAIVRKAADLFVLLTGMVTRVARSSASKGEMITSQRRSVAMTSSERKTLVTGNDRINT